MNIKSMNTEELLSLDFDVLDMLSESELRKIVTKVGSTVNKRLKRLEAAGLSDTPAAARMVREGGKISVRGKTAEQVKAEYMRAKGFYNAPTGSTVSGVRQYEKKVQRDFARKGYSVSDSLMRKYQRLYDESKDLTPERIKQIMKYMVKDDDTIMVNEEGRTLEDAIDRIFEELQDGGEQESEYSLSEWFE